MDNNDNNNNVRTLSAKELYEKKELERRSNGKSEYRRKNYLRFGDAKFLGQLLSAKPDVDYKREIGKYDHHDRLYGIELEIELANCADLHSGIRSEETASKIKFIAENFGIDCYSCRDGSLQNGLEIVTAPRTLDEIYSRRGEIRAGLKNIVKLGGRSHDTSTCGLHVHVSRDLLTSNVQQRLRSFLRTNKKHYLKISRRSEDSWDRWCSTSARGSTRYRAINETPNTLEFRIFRGTLKPETFFAAIELVDATIEYVQSRTTSDSNKRISFKQFVQYVHKNCKRYIYLSYQFKSLFADLLTPTQRRTYTVEEREQRAQQRAERAAERVRDAERRAALRIVEQAQLLDRIRSLVATTVASHVIDLSHSTDNVVRTRLYPVDLVGLTQQERRLLDGITVLAPVRTIGSGNLEIVVRRSRGWGRTRWSAYRRYYGSAINQHGLYASQHLSNHYLQ